MSSSRLLPPRFFQLDSAALQSGLEARLVDLVHSSVAPLLPDAHEALRASVELCISCSCFVLGLLASRSEQQTGYAVAYGDQIYGLRYVAGGQTVLSAPMRHNNLLSRLLIRFLLLQPIIVGGAAHGNNRNAHIGRLLYTAARNLERGLRLCDLLNHVHFLYDGTYRNFVDRLVGVRLASGDRELQLSAHTYLIDRQHYWSTVFAAMSLFVPMLNVSAWIAWAGRHVRRFLVQVSSIGSATASATASSTVADNGNNSNSRQLQQLRQQQMNFECLVCHTDPMAMPQRAKECGHVCVCYFCSATHKPDACPLCHEAVTKWLEA